MKSLKVFLSILLCLSTLFAVTACGGGGQSECKLNKTEVVLNIDGTITLELTEDDVVITDGISWSSSDHQIATVNKGVVLAKGEGNCMITATYNKKDYTCVVTVTTQNSYGIDKTSLIVEVDRTQTINFTNNGNNVSLPVTWTSGDTNIATVNNGVVTGVGEGTVIVSAKYQNKTYNCTVTVKKKFVTEGTFVAQTEGMGKTHTFHLVLNTNNTFVYTNIDKGDIIAQGNFTYENQVLTLIYGDKRVTLNALDENTVKGTIEIGAMHGMTKELTFNRKIDA